ncbi:MAG: M56 family metallopeptidase [Pyrinomonadaceae bacterium]
MNFETLLTSRLVADLGWTLLNSVWQIAVISGLLYAVLHLLRERSANLRYAVSVAALAAASILPIITFIQIAGVRGVNRQPGDRAETAIEEKLRSDQRVAQPQPGVAVTAGSVLSSDDATQGSVLGDIRAAIERRLPSAFPFAVSLWVLGLLFYSFCMAGGLWQLHGYKTCGIATAEEPWQRRFADLCDGLDVTSKVRLVSSAVIETPIAVGFLRPMIIVPASVFLQISPRELETIIAHELIHIRRHDPLVNAVQSVIETLFFYHPGIWWISSQIRREREFAADAAVLKFFDGSHATYANALANLEEIRLMANQQMPLAATAANGGNLMQRIQRILNVKTEARGANSAWTAGLTFMLTSAVLLAVFSFNSSNLVNARGKSADRKLAIGFVSIPPLDRTDNPPKDSDATARLLIEKLKAHKVPAIGFLQGGMISDGEKMFPVRANIARLWKDAGFEIGLGGFRHIELYSTPVDEYIANIEKNERVAKQLIGDTGLPPRYFSYPYLNAGKTAGDRAKVEAWLANRGYTPVKYTIDNNEWMYSYAYDMARNDNDVNTMNEIRDAYLSYMSKMFDHYEAYSKEMFGRDIRQTMVLTPSRLITDTADEFFGMLKKRGYSFITVGEAQSDEAYKTKESFTGQAGISWFERWAMASGRKLRDEPEIDADVQKIWNERKKAGKK